MGLFRKKEPEKPVEPKYQEIFNTFGVNITDKMLQVELVDTSASLERCELKQNGDMIQLIHCGIILATIGKKGKAYADLQPYIGKRIDSVKIRLKKGDYGDYYALILKVYEGRVIVDDA